MNETVVRSLDRNIANEHITMPYPNVTVLNVTEALPLIVPSLPEGDLAVLCEYNGTCRKIGSICNSPRVLYTLSKVSELVYYKSQTESFPVRNAIDALEVFV